MSLASIRAKNSAVNLAGKRALVVGGTSGIGQSVAMRLAQANASVTIVGRNRARGQEIVESMTRLGGSNHRFIECDVQLLSNVKALAEQEQSQLSQQSQQQPLDLLVLSQGIATIQGRTETAEGLDQKLSLHYYSRMAFVRLLLPQLRQSTAPKVLTVLSAGVHGPYGDYAIDPELKTHFSIKNAADAAGFYNDLAIDTLSQEPGNERIAFIHAAPGFVNTNWGTEMPWYLRGLIRMIQPLGRSMQDCGEFLADPLLDASIKPGYHLIDYSGSTPRTGDLRTKLHTAEAREFIWKHTQEVFQRILGKF